MSVRSIAVVTMVLAVCAPLDASAATSVPYVPVSRGGAVILNSGSTNALGYRISVGRSGDAWYVVPGEHMQRARIPADLARRFFADLRAAMPLSSVVVPRCMKSASFGTSVFVWWHGSRSPDVSCGSSALYADAQDVAVALRVSLTTRFLPTGEPRRTMPSPLPSP